MLTLRDRVAQEMSSVVAGVRWVGVRAADYYFANKYAKRRRAKGSCRRIFFSLFYRRAHAAAVAL